MNKDDIETAWDLILTDIETPFGLQPDHYVISTKIIEMANRYKSLETNIYNQLINLADSLKIIHNAVWEKDYTDEDRKTARKVFDKELKVLIDDLNKLLESKPDLETILDTRAFIKIAMKYLN